jgi:diguanylate cyclase (GGDEF)-like protein
VTRRINRWLEDLHAGVTTGLAVVVVALLGIVDYASGPQIAFSVFYLLPVSLVGWKSAQGAAAAVAALAATTWIIADVSAGQEFARPWIAVWNAGTRLAMFLIVVRLLASLRRVLDVQTRLATLDSLTNVLNPRAFAAALGRVVDEAARDGTPFSFAYIDLDDFKQVNDRLGHSGGDRTLAVLAQTLEQSLRATDVVGRLGGDEFGIVFPGTGSAAAKRVMGDLVTRVRRGVREMPIEVTFSIGAVTFLTPSQTIDEVIKASDELMYQAKSCGKNQYLHKTVGADDERAVPDETRGRARSLEASRAL